MMTLFGDLSHFFFLENLNSAAFQKNVFIAKLRQFQDTNLGCKFKQFFTSYTLWSLRVMKSDQNFIFNLTDDLYAAFVRRNIGDGHLVLISRRLEKTFNTICFTIPLITRIRTTQQINALWSLRKTMQLFFMLSEANINYICAIPF